MSKHTRKNAGNGTDGLWKTMVDSVKSGDPMVVKGVAAVGIVLMVVTGVRVIGQLFQ